MLKTSQRSLLRNNISMAIFNALNNFSQSPAFTQTTKKKLNKNIFFVLDCITYVVLIKKKCKQIT